MSKKPNFFIIGAPKSGTSALAFYLAQHPNVFFSHPKEPFYWCSDYPGLRKLNGVETLDEYLKLFEGATKEHQRIGDGSTNYLASKTAIKNILEFDPAAKFIAMFRNPVQVAHGFHGEVLFSLHENEPDFESAWRLQDARASGNKIPSGCDAEQFLQYRDVAGFGKQVERFFELVPESNRKVFIFDDLSKDTGSIYRKALEFLDLPDDGRTEFPRVNESGVRRLRWLYQFVTSPPKPIAPIVLMARRAWRRQNSGFANKVRGSFKSKQKRKPMSPEFESELNDFFRADVEKLSQLIGRDLTHWVTEKRETVKVGS